MTQTSFPFRKVYGAASMLAFITVTGLLSALFGDGMWDIASWLLLGIPIAVLIRYLLRSFRMRHRSHHI